MTVKKEKEFVINNVRLMAEWDWEKNNDLGISPNSFTLGSDKKVWWTCDKGHSYEARISNKNHGQGCPYCAGKKVLVGYNDLQTWCFQNGRPDLIEEFDSTKNAFSMQDITPGSGKSVWWLCPNGHSYSATLHHRIKMNTGCGVCSHKVFLSGHNDLLSTNPEIAKEFDVEKNGVTPDQVMAGSNNKKYWFLCPKGHSYSTTLLNRKKGSNCPICTKEMHISFPEKAIFYYLLKLNIRVEENYHASFLGKKEFDIYLVDLKIAIEYDGREWHKSIKRDLEKDELCQKNDIHLIRVREEGCPTYDSPSTKYYVQGNNIHSLECAIDSIVSFINKIQPTKVVVDIDIERDRNHIYELLELNEKKNSLLDKCPEIESFWNKEMNGILTPKQISFSSIKKIHLICELGHQWISTAHDFIRSPRCPICSGERILPGFNDLGTTSPELKEIWSDKNEKSIDNYSYGSNEKVLWKCNICYGEYIMQISDKAIKKFGCPYCNNRKLLKGFNDLSTKCPDLIIEWSSQNRTKPEDYLYCSKETVYWECPNNHIYQAKIVSRSVNNKGCPYCHNIEILKGFNDLETCNPSLAREFDIEKNQLLPSEVLYGGINTYWWKCKKGHSYAAKISNRIREQKKGYGCPICSNHRVLRSYNDLQTINPTLAAEFDVQKNSGRTPEEFTPKSGKKVWWLCSKCGYSWAAQIIKRNSGQGCPACAGKIVVEGMNDLSTRYPSISEDWDYVKNSPLMPTHVMPRSRKAVWWKCKKCGYEWEQKIINRTRAPRCPKCGK